MDGKRWLSSAVPPRHLRRKQRGVGSSGTGRLVGWRARVSDPFVGLQSALKRGHNAEHSRSVIDSWNIGYRFSSDHYIAGYLFDNLVRGQLGANADGVGYHRIDDAGAAIRVMGRRVPQVAL
jgi:hypothetical protein